MGAVCRLWDLMAYAKTQKQTHLVLGNKGFSDFDHPKDTGRSLCHT
jgi:hypothetical protein